jgi:23S rRNA (guanosine2251-2'-O)-methyltransferase
MIIIMQDKEADKFTPSNILEGMISIRSLLLAREEKINNRQIEKILFDKTKTESKQREISFLNTKALTHGYKIEATGPDEIDSLTVGNTHGGIIALCGERSFASLAENIKPDSFYVMLEGVEDPYNFGYALRSVYAAGAGGVVLSPRNWMGAAGVVCRASAGASELMPMFISDGAEAAVLFKTAGYKIVCAEKKDAVSVYETDLHLPVFLIVGGEKRGISRTLLDTADILVKLDYGRIFPAALSTASAAAILAYEVLRQNRI